MIKETEISDGYFIRISYVKCYCLSFPSENLVDERSIFFFSELHSLFDGKLYVVLFDEMIFTSVRLCCNDYLTEIKLITFHLLVLM